MKKYPLVLAGLLATLSAFGHGGHTALESNFWHYVLSPDHLFFLVVFLVAVGTLLARWRRAKASAKSGEDR